jgi:hypothetical protein
MLTSHCVLSQRWPSKPLPPNNWEMQHEARSLAQRAYHSARRRRLYAKDCYMISNESEYWAEGCQSWFDATVRCGASR